MLVANFPVSTVDARNFERDSRAARLMNELIKYTFEKNIFDYTFMMAQKSSMLFDASWVKVCWDYKDSNTDHATIEMLNSFDIYPHPRKIKLDDRWPIYIRREMTKAQMIEEGFDKRRVNTLSVSKLGDGSYRKEQLQAMGYSGFDKNDANSIENPKDDLYEVVEAWGMRQLKGDDAPEEMSCVVLANNEAIINPGSRYEGDSEFQSPYKHGKIPLSYLPYDPLPNQLLGSSFIDPIAGLQEELNVLEIELVNNTRRRNNPPLKIRRSGGIDLSTLKFVNAMPWMVNEPDDITQELIADLSPSIEAQQNRIRSIMQAVTGANDVLLVSTDTQIQGGKTATGASIANENTKMRFRPQAKFIDLFVERVGDMVISIYQDERFFDQEKAIAIADEEGRYFEQMISNKDIKGDLQFSVQSGSSLAESDEMKLSKAVNLKQLYMEDQSIKMDEIDRVIFESAGFDFNKVKRPTEDMIPELTMRLQKLLAITQQPGFQSASEAQKQEVLGQIDQLKQMLSQLSGQQQTPPPDQVAPPDQVPEGQA